MKIIESKDGQLIRRVLIGMITNNEVISKIVPKWPKAGLFSDKWSNLIGGWCVRFYTERSHAPNIHINSLYENWANSNQRDKAVVESLERFLSFLSDQQDRQEQINSGFLVDEAARHFEKVALQKLIEHIQSDVDAGDLTAARARVTQANQVELGAGAGIDVMRDKAAMQSALTSVGEPLVVYPGALGRFFGTSMVRDSFLALEAPEKRSKSTWAQDLGYRLATQRRKVAFFDAGDMSQDQVMARLMSRVSRHPIFAGTVKYPIDITRDRDAEFAVVTHEEKVFKSDMDWRVAWNAWQKVIKHKIRSDEPFFKLSCHPNNTLSLDAVKDILRSWERSENFHPDCVIIDYAELLTPPHGIQEKRDQIDQVWKQLRGLSQSLHGMVVTVAQTDTASYGQRSIHMKNFSDAKNKNAHITGMIGINQVEEERNRGILRLNWVAGRGAFSRNPEVHVAECLALANPCVRSCS